MPVRELKIETDVISTIEKATETAKDQEMEAALIVLLPKEGGPILTTSTCSGYQRVYMAGFVAAWIAKWYFGEEPCDGQ